MLQSVTTKSEITVVERITLGPGWTQRVVDAGANTTQLKLTAESTPPMSEKSHFAQPLSGGTATIDLLALVDASGAVIGSTGLRVQALKVQNPNAHALVVAPSTTDGYALAFTVPAEGEILLTSTNLLPAIGSTSHRVDLTASTTSAAPSNWLIVLG